MARFKITRAFYTPKTDIIESKVLDNGLEYYLTSVKNSEHVIVTAFGGKRQKPDIYARYRNIAQAQAAVEQWLKNQESHEAYKQERKEQIKKARTNGSVKVGDIFIASWGYDQTNVDAYQVVELVGKATVVVREIATKGVPGTDGFMCQNVVAVPNKFTGKEEFTRRILAWGDSASIKIDDCRTAHYEAEIRPHYCSWYA